MDGEFKVLLKKYDQAQLVTAFNENFTNNFTQAYEKSAYQASGILKQSDFCTGYITKNSLFLVYNREGDTMKIYVEIYNLKDVGKLKTDINSYFESITRMLDRKKIKWERPQATITLENYELYGVMKTRKERIMEIFKEQREKLFLVPIGSFAVSFAFIHWHVLEKDDGAKDLLKAVSATAEAYVGLLLLLIVQFLFEIRKRNFIFNF